MGQGEFVARMPVICVVLEVDSLFHEIVNTVAAAGIEARR